MQVKKIQAISLDLSIWMKTGMISDGELLVFGILQSTLTHTLRKVFLDVEGISSNIFC